MQKLVNGHLYVFDLTPFTLESGTDAEVIYVQNECVQGYKDLNSEVADKIKGFNQFLLCVNKQEWSQEEDGGDSGDTLYTLTVNCDSTFAALAAGGQFGVVGRCTPDNKPALEGDTGFFVQSFIYDEQNPEQVIGLVVNDMPEGCQFQFDERSFPAGFNLTSSPVLETGTDNLADLGQTYVMPASDVTISLSVQADVEPVAPYTLIVNYSPAFASAVNEIDPGALTQICGIGDENHQPSLTGVTDWVFPSSTTKDEQDQYVVEAVYSLVPEGWQFQFDERKFPAGFNLTSSPVLETGTESLWEIGQTYVMPASDVTVTLTTQEDVQQ